MAVDSVSPTVFTISENGELLKWFDCSDYMREPSDIAVNGNEYYVCDFKVPRCSNLNSKLSLAVYVLYDSLVRSLFSDLFFGGITRL